MVCKVFQNAKRCFHNFRNVLLYVFEYYIFRLVIKNWYPCVMDERKFFVKFTFVLVVEHYMCAVGKITLTDRTGACDTLLDLQKKNPTPQIHTVTDV